MCFRILVPNYIIGVVDLVTCIPSCSVVYDNTCQQVKVCKALFEMRKTISFPLAHRATKYVTQMSGYEKAAKIVNSNT